MEHNPKWYILVIVFMYFWKGTTSMTVLYVAVINQQKQPNI